jgi:spore coat protein U-like protein
MQSNRFFLLVWIGLQTVLLVPDVAQAACRLSSAAIAFGNYDPLIATALDTAGSVVYRCAPQDRNITITLSRGGGTSFATRRMVNGTDRLFYNLYRDAARTTIWGDGTNGTQSYFIGNPANNQDISVAIFGRIPASQNVKVGAYTDTITVTLSF